MIKTVLKEPLLHFLIIGSALFFVYGQVSDSNSDDRIVVSAGRIEQLANIFAKTWQRAPTAEELKGIIDDFELEEIYNRQAAGMGLAFADLRHRRHLGVLGDQPVCGILDCDLNNKNDV